MLFTCIYTYIYICVFVTWYDLIWYWNISNYITLYRISDQCHPELLLFFQRVLAEGERSAGRFLWSLQGLCLWSRAIRPLDKGPMGPGKARKVGGFNLPQNWKMTEFDSWDDDIPNISQYDGKVIQFIKIPWFQTTKQYVTCHDVPWSMWCSICIDLFVPPCLSC